jgi:hypothetical protein
MRRFHGATLREREVMALGLLLLSLAVLYAFPGSRLGPVLPLALAAGAIWAVFLLHHFARLPHLAVLCVFVVGVFQNLLLGFLNPSGGDARSALLLVAFTTALPVAFCLWWLITKSETRFCREHVTLHVIAILYLAVAGIGALISQQPILARIPALRNLVSFLAMFYMGFLLPGLDEATFKRIVRGFGWLVVLTVAFGYLERFVLGDAFWVDVFHIDFVARVKGLTMWGMGLPEDFYSPLGGHAYRRMASLFGTAITMGYFVAFGVFFGLYGAWRQQGFRRQLAFLWVGVLLVTLAVTLVKGAYQIVAVGGVALLLGAIGWRRRWSFAALTAMCVLLAVPMVVAGVLLFRRSTVLLHVYGLFSSFASLQGSSLVLGRGVGTGGAISLLIGGDLAVAGAESGIGSLVSQLGLVGVLLYLAFFLSVLRLLYGYVRSGETTKDLRIFMLCLFGADFGLLSNAFLQENAFAPIPVSFYLVFTGVALNLAYRQRRARLARGELSRAR